MGAALASLDATLLEAPELDRIQASSAAAHLLRALGLGAEPETRVVGLLHYARALEDLQQRNLAFADRELGSARGRLGWTVDLRVLAGTIARERGLRVQAAEHVDKALAMRRGHPRALLLAADLALDTGDAQRALYCLELLARAEPRSSCILNRRGLAREALSDYEGAARDYRRAAELDARSSDPQLNLGRLFQKLGRNDQALRAFTAATERAPSDRDAWLGKGLCHMALGEQGRAEQAIGRAVELAPSDAAPLVALGDVLRRQARVAEAIAAYRAALGRDDASAASWLKLGNALVMDRQPSAAAGAYREAIARSPELAAAHNGLGVALMALGQSEQATAALLRAARLDASDPNPARNLAIL